MLSVVAILLLLQSGLKEIRYYVDGVLFATVPATHGDGTYNANLDITKLSNGMHTLQVKAVDNAGNIGSSTTSTIIVDNPVVPMNLAASASGLGVALTWTSPDSGKKYTFEIFRRTSSGSFSRIATTRAHSYTDGNVVPGVYYYRVREKDNTRYSAFSNVANVAVPQ